jgi:hypothetical protein
MATLDELMSDAFGQGSVKTASRRADAGQDDLDALLASLDADAFGTKEASEDEDDEGDEEAKDEKKEMKEEVKKASFAQSSSLFEMIYGRNPNGNVKTAAEEKIAYQQNIGRAAYRSYEATFDDIIEKVASAVLKGDVTIKSPTGGSNKDNPHMDATHPQQSATDKPADAKHKINLTPVYEDEVRAHNDDKTVGHYEAVRDPDSAKTASLALRKAVLLSQLEDEG